MIFSFVFGIFLKLCINYYIIYSTQINDTKIWGIENGFFLGINYNYFSGNFATLGRWETSSRICQMNFNGLHKKTRVFSEISTYKIFHATSCRTDCQQKSQFCARECSQVTFFVSFFLQQTLLFALAHLPLGSWVYLGDNYTIKVLKLEIRSHEHGTTNNK